MGTKARYESESFGAQNQLGLATIKSLDILNKLGFKDVPILGLVTLGPVIELWIGYLGLPGTTKYVMRKVMLVHLNYVGSIQFILYLRWCRALQTLFSVLKSLRDFSE